MFVGYTARALVGNWFHRALFAMLARIHADVTGGRTPPEWDRLIPTRFRDRIHAKRGLRSRIERYQAAFIALGGADRTTVHQAMFAQNRISDLLSAARGCRQVDELPESIREPAKDLFSFAFELLTDLEVRDPHYATIYEALRHKICPFCGLNAFDAPGAPREDDDHYLPRSRYPFAAANLSNLVPMCHKCNARYKHTGDPLWDGGRRRTAVNPYAHAGFGLDLTRSAPDGGTSPYVPRWVIDFVPATPEAETWDEVFALRQRIARDVLDCSYRTWIRDYGAWCRASNHIVEYPNQIPATLLAYEEYLAYLGLSDRSFLRRAVCRMLYVQCLAENEEILSVLFAEVQVD